MAEQAPDPPDRAAKARVPPGGPATGERNESIAQALAASGFGVLLVDSRGRVAQATIAACELLGHAEETLVGQPLVAALHPDDRGWSETELDLLLAGAIRAIRQSVRLTDLGAHASVELHARAIEPQSGDGGGAVVLVESSTDRDRGEHELRRLADRDPLTDVYNRRRFISELDRHLALARRYGDGGAVLLLDIDNLKQVNDTRGHRAGDELIVDTTKLLQAQLRETDVIGRIGGDEFAVLLRDVDLGQAATIADALIAAAHKWGHRRPADSCSLSIGVTLIAADEPGPAAVLERADAAMYAAKRRGGNGYAIGNGGPAETGPGFDGDSRSAQGADPASLGTRLVPVGPAGPRQPVDLLTLLETVAELGTASRGLVAWELGAEQAAVTQAWAHAVSGGLIERAGYDHEECEWLYRLTQSGELRSTQLRQ